MPLIMTCCPDKRAVNNTSAHERRCGQTGHCDVVNVGMGKAVGAGVVLEGGNHPVLGLRSPEGDRRHLF